MFLRQYLSYFSRPLSSQAASADAKPSSEQKTYHKKATGIALGTVKRHSKEHELKLFGSCFWYVSPTYHASRAVLFRWKGPFCADICVGSPFVQRVWIALEIKDLDYQYIEVDPYTKPQSLLEVNPLGLVPALRHGDWACHESTVLVEYVRLFRAHS